MVADSALALILQLEANPKPVSGHSHVHIKAEEGEKPEKAEKATYNIDKTAYLQQVEDILSSQFGEVMAEGGKFILVLDNVKAVIGIHNLACSNSFTISMILDIYENSNSRSWNSASASAIGAMYAENPNNCISYPKNINRGNVSTTT